MRRVVRSAFVAMLVVSASHAALAAGAFEIYLNDKAARATVASRVGASNFDLDFGLLHHSDRGEMYAAGLHYAGFAGAGGREFEVRIGGRAAIVDADAGSGSAFLLGGEVRYRIPQRERFWVGLSMHYAPSVLALGDARSMYDLGLSAEYRVLDRAAVQLKLAHVRTAFDGGAAETLDRGLHVGFRLQF